MAGPGTGRPLESALYAHGVVWTPGPAPDRIQIYGLPARKRVHRCAVLFLCDALLSFRAGSFTRCAGTRLVCDFHFLRIRRCRLCLALRHLLERKAVLALSAEAGRLDLWPLCESQPLCGLDGI